MVLGGLRLPLSMVVPRAVASHCAHWTSGTPPNSTSMESDGQIQAVQVSGVGSTTRLTCARSHSR